MASSLFMVATFLYPSIQPHRPSLHPVLECSFEAREEAQRSTDVLATFMDSEGEAFEMDNLGEEEPDSPSHDKSTALLQREPSTTIRRGTLLPRKFAGLEAEVEGPGPDRWVMSDIFRQKCEEQQVRLMALSFLSVRSVLRHYAMTCMPRETADF